MRILSVILMFFLCGCASKTVTKYKCDIPKSLLQTPKFSVGELNTQSDYAILMLDIYEAYEKCALNLKSIERLQR